jgi:hypothetical protein
LIQPKPVSAVILQKRKARDRLGLTFNRKKLLGKDTNLPTLAEKTSSAIELIKLHTKNIGRH